MQSKESRGDLILSFEGNMAQRLFVMAVVVPELLEVVSRYESDILELANVED